jgi:hypothetical protein
MRNRYLLAAAACALLAVTMPSQAATVETLDADLHINYGSGLLAGTLDLQRNDFFPCCGVQFPEPYFVADGTSLSLNGSSLLRTYIGNYDGYPGIHEVYAHATPGGLFGGLFDLKINTTDIGDLTFSDFVGATGGTVTVLSETFATPLPATLPLFAIAILALVGGSLLYGRKSGSSAR